MAYELEIKVEAMKVLRAMPPEIRRQIGFRLHQLQQDFSGDVVRLRGSMNEFRLRVGNQRVLFLLIGNRIEVFAVGDRKEIHK